MLQARLEAIKGFHGVRFPRVVGLFGLVNKLSEQLEKHGVAADTGIRTKKILFIQDMMSKSDCPVRVNMRKGACTYTHVVQLITCT